MTSVSTMTSSLDIAQATEALGTSTGLCRGPHRKKQRCENVVDGTESKLEYRGSNGYVYTVKYTNGAVILRVDCGEGVFWGESQRMSTRNWKLFRTVVCADLDNVGFPEMLYVSQWNSPTGPELYRVEADRFNRSPDDFIFLSVCDDRESFIAARGVENWRLNPYPLSIEERTTWFKDMFFIQWCDWRAMLHMFSKVDDAIKRDRLNTAYEGIRKRLVFDDFATCPKTGLPSTLCKPKIIRPSDN
ncbi:unnamed protein product [Oreochromis niloticus]|nr:unnamed protein product [Mustela putorius furo]